MAILTQAQIDERAARNQRLLGPIKEIMEDWVVEVEHAFQDKIRDVQLIANGRLESDWTVSLVSKSDGVLVAEYAFRQYGRIMDMRSVSYARGGMRNYDKIKEWVEAKVANNEIKYSTLASKLGVQYGDPRVINDLTYRFATARTRPKARKWYNSTKEVKIQELYTRLQERIVELVTADIKQVAESSASVSQG